MLRRGLLAAAVALAGCGVSSADSQPRPAATPEPSATAASPSDDSLAGFYSQEVSWRECEDGAECATIDVPRSYDDPSGETIEISLLRVPATDRGRRIGSLLVNPGGPGASGVEYAAAADAIVSPDVRGVFDVVGFDPRGVARSTPVDCVTDDELNESLSEGDASPDTPAEVDEMLASTREFHEGCQDKSGDLIPHIGTQDVARDLDVIREVLGDPKLTYIGKSYGTSIGLEYARQFPDRAGRLVLDGVVDPTLDSRELLLGQAGGFELALSRFADHCQAQGCLIASDRQTALDVVDWVLATTDESPMPTQTRPLSQVLAFYGIAGPLYWPPQQGYPLLDQALQMALDGDGTGLLGLADIYLQRNPDGSFQGNTWDVATPVSCLDRPSDAEPQDVQAAMPDFVEASPRFGELMAWGMLSCTDWPVPTNGLPAPVAAPGAPPILVVGTTADPATPYPWAVSVADQLDSGVLLTYEGTPHTAYRKGSSCIDSIVDEYLLNGVVPPDATRCT